MHCDTAKSALAIDEGWYKMACLERHGDQVSQRNILYCLAKVGTTTSASAIECSLLSN